MIINKLNLLNKIIIIAILIVVTCSCASRQLTIKSSFNDKHRTNLTRLDNTNFELLNGYFENNSDSTGFSMLEKSILKIDLNGRIHNNKDTTVVLRFMNKKKLNLSLIANNKIIYEKRFKGKIISGLFVFKRQVKIEGIPLLFWQYQDQITALGLYNNKDLILFVNLAGSVLVTIAPMMPTPNSALGGPSIYKRIKNN